MAFTLLDECERKCTIDSIVARRWVGVKPGHHLGLLLGEEKGTSLIVGWALFDAPWGVGWGGSSLGAEDAWGLRVADAAHHFFHV